MDASVGPVRRGARDAVLLDGDAVGAVLRAAKDDSKLSVLCERLAPLKLFVARPEDAFDPIKDANYFVVDDGALRRRLSGSSHTVIVDVSPGSAPQVLQFDSLVYGLAARKATLCVEALDSFRCEGSRHKLPCLLPDGELDSVILGVLLGYPVVYYSNDISGNSLSSIPLRLFSLKETHGGDPFTSFSVPECLLDDPTIKLALNGWRQEMKQRNLCIIDRTISLPSISL